MQNYRCTTQMFLCLQTNVGGMPGGMGGMGGMGGFEQMMGGGMRMGGFPGMDGMGMGMGGMPGGMGGRGGARPRPQQPQPDVIPPDVKVVLHSLKSKASYNGAAGVVQSYNTESSRYTIALEDGSQLDVKSANFTQTCSVKLTNLEGRVDLNGCSATIVGWDEGKQRYQIRVTPRGGTVTTMLIRPGNVVLPKSTRIRVDGLTGAPQYNNRWGQITQFDEAAGRYVVDLGGGNTLRLKLENAFA
jgi:hypothetical protein